MRLEGKQDTAVSEKGTTPLGISCITFRSTYLRLDPGRVRRMLWLLVQLLEMRMDWKVKEEPPREPELK